MGTKPKRLLIILAYKYRVCIRGVPFIIVIPNVLLSLNYGNSIGVGSNYSGEEKKISS